MTPDEQIDEIIRLMLSGRWQGMKTRAELAKQWDIHERTVGERAKYASAFLVRQGKDIEEEAREALAELDNLKRMALSYVEVSFDKEGNVREVPQPKLREATDAIELKMKILGVTSTARGRNDRQKPDVEDKYANATREERIAMLKEALDEEMAADREKLQ